jgi:Flp pilus assembly protein TadB
VVADALAMQIVSGESVSTATGRVASSTTGVASDELDAALFEAEHERSFPEALVEAGKSSAHADGRRLYETLAHAHMAGGRLSESLTNLSADFRASLERDLMSEGGKRAIASYGPILALMVPTALLFLLYPTLLGLRALSGAP